MAADVALEISLLRASDQALLGAFASLTHRIDGLDRIMPTSLSQASQQDKERTSAREQRDRVRTEILRRMADGRADD